MAEATEAAGHRRGIILPSGKIDGLLNMRISRVAYLMRIGSRAALDYGPDSLPKDLAAAVAEALDV